MRDCRRSRPQGGLLQPRRGSEPAYNSAMSRDALLVWPLPVAVALVPVLAAHLAFALSAATGYVPECMPYWDGCASISRAARHGLGNHLFRLLMLPTALLLSLHWLAARRWLRLTHPDPAAGRSLLALGVFTGVALAVYVTFLGTEGEVYQWLRRYGARLYFASTYLAQLVFLRRYRQIAGSRGALYRWMLIVSVGMLVLGLGNTAAAYLVGDEALKDRLENLLEWQLGLLMTGWFLLQAALWRRTGFRFSLARD